MMNRVESSSSGAEGLPAEALRLGGDWGRAARDYLDAARERLFAWHREGASGTAVVRAYTAAVDGLIQVLFDASLGEAQQRFPVLDQRFALVAQGGYGRAELNPYSDLDLLFLYPHKSEPLIEYVAERILYTLWDARLTVGNALRNVRECLRLAANDFKVKTALLDVRFLCGDQTLFQEFARRMEKEVLNRDVDRFFDSVLAEIAARHHRYGDSVYLLEPQIKEGQGGLRELHAALWLAKVKFKTNRLPELVQKGVLTEREQEEAESARDFLFRVRNSLHFLARGHQDQLTFEYQERIAPLLGFHDTPNMKGVEHFMRAYYMAAATLDRFAADMIERCVRRPRSYFSIFMARPRRIRPGVTIAQGLLSIAGPELLQSDPSNFVRLFLDAQRHEVKISRATKRVLREHLHWLDDHWRSHPATVEAFFQILRGRNVAETLREMHQTGVLGAFLPEFGALTCMVLHDVYHTYTVDEHSLRAVQELEWLRAGKYQDMVPLLTHVMRDLDRVDLLLLGMLLHDIGKGRGGGHCERGAAMCDAIAARLHLNPDDAAQLKFLVAQHLNMSHLAQRRDIHDPRLIIDFARRVETLDNLKRLYLLTFADMRAVGPKIWNSWHDMLLSELYLRTAEVFEREAFIEEDYRERAARVRQRVAAASTVPEAVRERFLRGMPDRYFLSTAEETILHHLELYRDFHDGEVVCSVRHFRERAFSEWTVVTADRPGLFAMITGVLLAEGMNILTANIHTSAAGVAVDVLRISHGDHPETVLNPERWERAEANLRAVLNGKLDVEDLVARARPRWTIVRRYTPKVPTAIEVDNQVSEHYTVLDVYTHDRVGLLFTITNTLFHLGISIHLAKITTNVDQVLDVFYVTDSEGRKILDPQELEHIRTVLLQRLAEDVTASPHPATATSLGG
ncbi:MAG: bifunctional uridylyltransferase/uridylyl-removing enzyme [Candidatus Binatia bacterium]|nr:MAG: bifunctional uridylyltransferase/uridylyl-removing enzyme [Candidatus Binatia bacterium]